MLLFFTVSHSNTSSAGKQGRDCQLQSYQQNLGMRLWNPWALSFPKLEMRKRIHLTAQRSFCISISSLHRTQGARWVTSLLQPTLLSPGRAGQPTADAHTLIMCSYHSRWSRDQGSNYGLCRALQRMAMFGCWSFLGRDSHKPPAGSKQHSRAGSDSPSVQTQQCYLARNYCNTKEAEVPQ